MTFILVGQIKPLQEEIAELQSKLKKAQDRLYIINQKVCKAEEPVSKIKSLASDLTKMFKNDPGILAEIKEHILSAFNSQDNNSIEKQENSPVVDARSDEEIVTKDVVKDAPQELPEPTKDVADDAPVVEKKVEDDKFLSTNKKPNETWTPPSKNNPTVEIIEREDKINLLVKNGLARINEFTNAVELYNFYEELYSKHPDIASIVKTKILNYVMNPKTKAWDKYKTISEIIPPGTPLEHDISKDKVEIVYYVRPCIDNTEGNQKYCEVLKSKPLKSQPTKIISFPEYGTNTRLAVNAEPPSPKIQKQIEDISSNKTFQKDINMILKGVNILEEIDSVKDQPVPF